MAIEIQANVVDLRSDQPRQIDRFFVDTNVWFWLTYSKASQVATQKYQTIKYPHYLQAALKVKSALYKCLLSFAELSHVIERSEFNIFCLQETCELSPKDFRHNFPTQRKQVIEEIELAWLQVDAFTVNNSLSYHVDQKAMDLAKTQIASIGVDIYDVFYVDALTSAGITQVITDDIDFGQFDGITVFTANNRLIDAARAQKKLITR